SQDRATAETHLQLITFVLRVCEHVGNVNGSAFEPGPTHQGSAAGGHWQARQYISQLWWRAVVRHSEKRIPPRPEDPAHFPATESRGVFEEGPQDWLEIERRATDDLQHLTGCRLLLEGLGQRAVALLQLGKKPPILDRDDGLRREDL